MKVLKKYESFEPEKEWEEEPEVFEFDHPIYNRNEIPFSIGDEIRVKWYDTSPYVGVMHGKIEKIKKNSAGTIFGDKPLIIIFKPYDYELSVYWKRGLWISGFSKKATIELIKGVNESFEPESQWEEIDSELPEPLEFRNDDDLFFGYKSIKNKNIAFISKYDENKWFVDMISIDDNNYFHFTNQVHIYYAGSEKNALKSAYKLSIDYDIDPDDIWPDDMIHDGYFESFELEEEWEEEENIEKIYFRPTVGTLDSHTGTLFLTLDEFPGNDGWIRVIKCGYITRNVNYKLYASFIVDPKFNKVSKVLFKTLKKLNSDQIKLIKKGLRGRFADKYLDIIKNITDIDIKDREDLMKYESFEPEEHWEEESDLIYDKYRDILPEVFVDFLVENDCFEKYVNNIKPSLKISDRYLRSFYSSVSIIFITKAFNWSETPEGGEYWLDIDNKWIRYISIYYRNAWNNSLKNKK